MNTFCLLCSVDGMECNRVIPRFNGKSKLRSGIGNLCFMFKLTVPPSDANVTNGRCDDRSVKVDMAMDISKEIG